MVRSPVGAEPWVRKKSRLVRTIKFWISKNAAMLIAGAARADGASISCSTREVER